MIQKTALSIYRTLVLTSIGSFVGCIATVVALDKLGVLKVPSRTKTDTTVKTDYTTPR